MSNWLQRSMQEPDDHESQSIAKKSIDPQRSLSVHSPKTSSSRTSQKPSVRKSGLKISLFLNPLQDLLHKSTRQKFLKKIRKVLRLRWVQVLLLFFIFGIMAWLVAPRAYNKLKSFRARAQMEKFHVAMQARRFDEAANFLKLAQNLRPDLPDVKKGILLFNAESGSPVALDAIQRLMKQNAATAEELLVLGEHAAKRNMPEITRQALTQLGNARSTRRTILEIRLKALDGDPNDVLQFAQISASTASSEDADKILLEGASIAIGEDWPASRDILIPLSKKPTATGLASLRILARGALSKAPAEEISGGLAIELKSHPLRNAGDLLLAADLQIASGTSSLKTLVDELIATRASASREDSLALVQWLILKKEYQAAVDFIGEDRARLDAAWLFLYLQAQAQLEKWDVISSLLNADDLPPNTASLRLLFLADVAEKNADTIKADEFWRELQLKIPYEPGGVRSKIIETALLLGHPDDASKLSWVLARRKETANEGFRYVLSQMPSSTTADVFISVYEEMLELLPTSLLARRGLAYYQLLAEKNIKDAAEISMADHKNSVNKNTTRHIAALALFRLGEVAKADSLYDAFPFPKNAPDASKAIRVAILRKMNRPDQADSIMATIDSTKLNPEEQLLLALP